MKSNIQAPLFYVAAFVIQRKAPGTGTTEYWETGYSRRGNWVDTSVEKILNRVVKLYEKWDIVEVQSRVSKWPNTKVYVAYGPELKDRRKKRFRILITLSNIKVIKSKVYPIGAFDEEE